jgi:hypothetical protein
MMRSLLASLFVLTFAVAPAQRSAGITSLRFVPMADEHPLPLDSDLVLANGATASVTKLRFYVSHVALHAAGRVVWNDGDRCHLVDASDSAQLIIALPTPAGIGADSVSFLLGVDSLTNVSGALGGDLDPTKGMYWAWNSGYINFKLEGRSPACAARDHRFEFHLGGYLPSDRSAQQVTVALTGSPVVSIALDISRFLDAVDLAKEYHVMSPGPAAVRLSISAANSFKQYAGK